MVLPPDKRDFSGNLDVWYNGYPEPKSILTPNLSLTRTDRNVTTALSGKSYKTLRLISL